jgi:HPt (histidine-containing phosphotransfer) domain-containing protein
VSDAGPIVVEVEDWVAHLVPRFLENRARDVVELRLAIAERNFEIIRRLGHNLRGAAAGYGFDDLTEVGEELEAAAAERNADSAAASTERLASYVTRVRVVTR